jgi:hypothetical protein
VVATWAPVPRWTSPCDRPGRSRAPREGRARPGGVAGPAPARPHGCVRRDLRR